MHSGLRFPLHFEFHTLPATPLLLRHRPPNVCSLTPVGRFPRPHPRSVHLYDTLAVCSNSGHTWLHDCGVLNTGQQRQRVVKQLLSGRIDFEPNARSFLHIVRFWERKLKGKVHCVLVFEHQNGRLFKNCQIKSNQIKLKKITDALFFLQRGWGCFPALFPMIHWGWFILKMDHWIKKLFKKRIVLWLLCLLGLYWLMCVVWCGLYVIMLINVY